MAEQRPEDEEREGIVDPIDNDQDLGRDGFLPPESSPRIVDGINHPSHARGVSVLTPEIISVFDVLPLFENTAQLAPGGQLFDVQTNARRVRINQMNALFEELTKDPKKDYAQIIERLKVGILKEMQSAQGDMRDLVGLYSNFYSMLIGFDISSTRNEPQVQALMQRVRNSRIQNSSPALVYPTIREVQDFTDLLKANHKITDVGVLRRNSSNTKLLYYIAWDIYYRTHVTLAEPAAVFTTIRSANPEIWNEGESSRFRFSTSPSLGRMGMDSDGVRMRGDGPSSQILYHPGRLGLSRHMLGIANDDTDIGENLGFYANETTLATVKAGSLEDPAEDLKDAAFFLSVACKDMAFSSLPESDSYRALLVDRMNREEDSILRHPGQQLFKNSFPQWHDQDTSSLNSLKYPPNFRDVGDDVTFARSIKRDPFNITDTSRPTPLFDPVLDAAPRGVFIENMQNLLRDKDTIEETLGNISGLEDIANGIEVAFALDVPNLQPVALVNKILEVYSDAITRLNPSRPPTGLSAEVQSPQQPIYNDGDFLDLAILSECIKNIDVDGIFPQRQQTRFADTTIPMIDLVNILLHKIGKDAGFYQNTTLNPGPAIVVDERQTVENPNIALQNGISSAIANYLVSRYEHFSDFFHSRQQINRDNLIRDKAHFGGVYFDTAPVADNNRAIVFSEWELSRSTSEEDTRSKVDINAQNSGYYNARNSNRVYSPQGARNVAKLMAGEKIETLINQAITGARPSIFRDIVKILNDMNDAALDRGEYFNPDQFENMKKMNHSGVDVSVIGSFILKTFAKISHQFTTVTFNEVTTRTNIESNRTTWVITQDRSRLEEFHRALQRFTDEGVEYFDTRAAQNSLVGSLISNMINSLRAERKVLIDGVDLFKAISLHADSNVQTYLQLFNSDNRVARLLESLGDDAGKILTIANPAQLALAGNKLENINKRLENEQYFDTFMMNASPEQAVLSAFINPEFTVGVADNLKLLAVGIPDGFSRSVLDYDIMSNEPEQKRSRVKVKVYRHDIILNDTILDFTPGALPGEARNGQVLKIKFKPREFEFDMRTFFKSISPIAGTGDIRVTQLDNEGNLIDHPRRIDERNYLEINDIFQNHMIFRKFIERGATFNDVTYPAAGSDEDKRLFINHCFDYIAKTYIRVMTGVNLAEESFLIDKEKENLTINSQEALEFFQLVQGYVNDVTNSETSLEDYLSGSRSTRELLRRLRGLQPAEPLLNSIDVEGNEPPRRVKYNAHRRHYQFCQDDKLS